MKNKVMVAMSGGVDSSVAAFLLKSKGYDVVGVTMCLGVKADSLKRPTCCGAQAIADAKNVCLRLEIPHYVMDFSKELEQKVISRFIAEYFAGRTPNPCVDCNRYLKFEILLKKAISLGFNFLATGHYAKIERRKRRYFLKRPADRVKDQTYFLYPIRKDLLRFILFPLADLTKAQVRNVARKENLPVAEKPQSQDICFIPDKNYKKFMSARKINLKPGRIVGLNGNILGTHKGIGFCTIGQRKGFGISSKGPLYVLSIDVQKNQIVLGEKKDLKAKGLIAGDINLLVQKLPQEVFAKIRYAHKEAKCEINLKQNRITAIFKQEQEAITPGQSVVFYDHNTVLGGGIIEEVVGGYN